jgi:hypothetical protein
MATAVSCTAPVDAAEEEVPSLFLSFLLLLAVGLWAR